MRTSPCRGCGKPIVWGTDADGKRIPLDPRPATYVAVEDIDSGEVSIERAPTTFVTHFATCPEAAKFSHREKRAS